MYYNKKFIYQLIVLLNHIEFILYNKIGIADTDCFTSWILQELDTTREKLLKDCTKK